MGREGYSVYEPKVWGDLEACWVRTDSEAKLVAFRVTRQGKGVSDEALKHGPLTHPLQKSNRVIDHPCQPIVQLYFCQQKKVCIPTYFQIVIFCSLIMYVNLFQYLGCSQSCKELFDSNKSNKILDFPFIKECTKS